MADKGRRGNNRVLGYNKVNFLTKERNMGMKKTKIAVLSFMVLICCFSNVNAKLKDYVGGEVATSVVYSKFNSHAGVPYYGKCGGDIDLKLFCKPLGLYAGIGFLSHFGGLDPNEDDRFSELFILKLGWEHHTVLDGIQFARLDIGVIKWDLPESEFCDWEAESDIVTVYAETEDLLWHMLDAHLLSSLLRVEVIIPIIKDTENLEGLNVSGSMIYQIKPAKQFSIFQKVRLGGDNGSFGYAPTWSLSYEVFGEFNFKNRLILKAPIVQAQYVSSQDEDEYDYKRDQNLYSFGVETVLKF